MIYLDLEDLLYVAGRVTGGAVDVRDFGLLASALARPQTIAFGHDPYPSLPEKVAALIHSLARNHGLVDGNRRLALGAAIAFAGYDGQRIRMTNDEAYDLIMAVAGGELDVPEIAVELVKAGLS